MEKEEEAKGTGWSGGGLEDKQGRSGARGASCGCCNPGAGQHAGIEAVPQLCSLLCLLLSVQTFHP